MSKVLDESSSPPYFQGGVGGGLMHSLGKPLKRTTGPY